MTRASNATPSASPSEPRSVARTSTIHATICDYDPADQAIYQPDLYAPNPDLPLVARVLALADIGTLGIEGIAAYNEEGCLIFLEENPDIVPILQQGKHRTLATDNPTLAENLRQRLLRRTNFQVNLAKSRLKRYYQEVQGLPPASLPSLTQTVFRHLNPDTIRAIEQSTPTHPDTELTDLIQFFDFETVVHQDFDWQQP
ncbi:MAG: hypothetical protein AAGC54_19205 [Cyanobacteria bacterium P01_F01_bin.4]